MSWPARLPLWLALTRLGEAQILLPVMLAVAVWLAWRLGARRAAGAWVASTALAAGLTTASKLAFLGHGIGWPALDFTGFSGHAMFAAAVLPPLLQSVAGAVPARQGAAHDGRPGWDGWAWAAGYALALLVAVSRVAVSAHSWSEVIGGFALGAIASAVALRLGRPWPALGRVRLLAPLLLAWALLGVAGAPPSPTHGWVTRLALAESGRAQPYQRWQMHQAYQQALAVRQRAAGPAPGPASAPPSLEAR